MCHGIFVIAAWTDKTESNSMLFIRHPYPENDKDQISSFNTNSKILIKILANKKHSSRRTLKKKNNGENLMVINNTYRKSIW